MGMAWPRGGSADFCGAASRRPRSRRPWAAHVVEARAEAPNRRHPRVRKRNAPAAGGRRVSEAATRVQELLERIASAGGIEAAIEIQEDEDGITAEFRG